MKIWNRNGNQTIPKVSKSGNGIVLDKNICKVQVISKLFKWKLEERFRLLETILFLNL